MSIEVKKEVTTSSDGPFHDQVRQTETSSQIPTYSEQRNAQSDRGNAWVWYIVGIVDLLLALRIIFHLFGARAVGFADFLYGITGPFVAPFRGIFPNPAVDGSYFDMASLTAIIVYVILGWIISGLINLATRPTDSKEK